MLCTCSSLSQEKNILSKVETFARYFWDICDIFARYLKDICKIFVRHLQEICVADMWARRARPSPWGNPLFLSPLTPNPPTTPHRDVLHLTAWHFAISTKDIFLLYLRKCACCQINVEELWSSLPIKGERHLGGSLWQIGTQVTAPQYVYIRIYTYIHILGLQDPD